MNRGGSSRGNETSPVPASGLKGQEKSQRPREKEKIEQASIGKKVASGLNNELTSFSWISREERDKGPIVRGKRKVNTQVNIGIRKEIEVAGGSERGPEISVRMFLRTRGSLEEG